MIKNFFLFIFLASLLYACEDKTSTNARTKGSQKLSENLEVDSNVDKEKEEVLSKKLSNNSSDHEENLGLTDNLNNVAPIILFDD